MVTATGRTCCRMRFADSRDGWLSVRREFVGASESPSILGIGYSSANPLTVWADKMGFPRQDNQERAPLKIGRLIEPGLRAIFEAETGWRVDTHGPYSTLQSLQWPHIGASLDGFIDDDGDIAEPVELKLVGSHAKDEWADGRTPLKYQVQVQHQLAVTGASRGYLLGVIGTEAIELRTIDRDDRFIEALVNALTDFWGHVTTQSPPPVDASMASTEALKRIYPLDNGQEIALPPEADQWRADIEAAKAAEKAAGDVIRARENQLKAALGEASVGHLPSGGQYTYRTQQRKGYVVEPTTFRVLRFSAK